MHKFVSVSLALLLLAGTASAGDYGAKKEEIFDNMDALQANEGGHSDSDRLARFIELFFDYVVNEWPEWATVIGHPTGHNRWTDHSLAALERRDAEERKCLEVLESIGRDQLEGEDRLNYDLLIGDLVDGVESQKFLGEYLAINQRGGVQQDVAQMITMMPSANRQQYGHILARLAAVPTLIAQTLVLLEKGLESGVTPPKITLRDVPQQVENLLVEDPMQSPMLRAFTKFPDSIPADEQERLKTAAVDVFTDKVAPAYRELHGYLVETYLPGARESIAMKDLPDGEEWYAFQVEQMTTTEMTPREIHDLGQSEVKRIRSEMDAVISDSGFEGSFEEFTEFLRTDPQFYFEKPEALLAAYRDICKRADAELIKLFGLLPRTPYGVIPVPEYAQKSQTTAYYRRGSLEAGRPGYFFANTYDLRTRPKWEMEALSLHEAVPGHHLQIAIAQEMEDLPWFRRFGDYTAFTEGWGLYSESLGEEMGFYQDPYSKFGQLTYEMWRAVRLVIDTGMHQFGWSRNEAIEFFKTNTAKSEHDIVVEVDRYIIMPGQALAYKIGALKLKELKARARKELGDKFDIRAFHDAVLGNGALPLQVLELHINDWIAGQKMPDSL